MCVTNEATMDLVSNERCFYLETNKNGDDDYPARLHFTTSPDIILPSYHIILNVSQL
jgi:hypothetical protein